MPITNQSRRTIMTTVFVACTSFSITLPSLWPYLSSLHATPSFLALVVAIYSVGEAVGALTLGPLTKTMSTRRIALLGNALAVLGSLLYVTPPPLRAVAPRIARWLVFTARFLHGVWTGGAQAYQQAYFAAVLPQRDIMEAIVTLNAYASAGFVFGPAFGFLLSFLPDVALGAGFMFSQLTGPGFVILLAALYTIYAYLYCFDEETDRESQTDDSPAAHAEVVDVGEADEHGPLLPLHPGEKGSATSLPSLLPLLLFCNVAFFIHFFSFALQETVTTPLLQELFGWTVRDATILFTLAGIATVLTFVAMTRLSAFASDRVFLLFSLAAGLVGNSLLIPASGTPPGLSPARFVGGFGLLAIVFSFGRASVVSLNTKLLPKDAQGVGQGVILAVGAVARIVGPFFGVAAVESLAGQAVVFGSVATLFLACAASMALIYRRLLV